MTADVITPRELTSARNGSGPKLSLPPTQEYFTFPSSGVTIVIQHVSTQVAQDRASAFRRKTPPPPVPVQTIDIGGEMTPVPNPTDPDYIKSLAKYELDLAIAQNTWFMDRAILTPNRELITKMVSEYRAKVLREDGIEYPDGDDHIFLWHLTCLDQSDYAKVRDFALYISRPTTEAIAEANNRFRD